jgi:hypothetical protein
MQGSLVIAAAAQQPLQLQLPEPPPQLQLLPKHLLLRPGVCKAPASLTPGWQEESSASSSSSAWDGSECHYPLASGAAQPAGAAAGLGSGWQQAAGSRFPAAASRPTAAPPATTADTAQAHHGASHAAAAAATGAAAATSKPRRHTDSDFLPSQAVTQQPWNSLLLMQSAFALIATDVPGQQQACGLPMHGMHLQHALSCYVDAFTPQQPAARQDAGGHHCGVSAGALQSGPPPAKRQHGCQQAGGAGAAGEGTAEQAGLGWH